MVWPISVNQFRHLKDPCLKTKHCSTACPAPDRHSEEMLHKSGWRLLYIATIWHTHQSYSRFQCFKKLCWEIFLLHILNVMTAHMAWKGSKLHLTSDLPLHTEIFTPGNLPWAIPVNDRDTYMYYSIITLKIIFKWKEFCLGFCYIMANSITT